MIARTSLTLSRPKRFLVALVAGGGLLVAGSSASAWQVRINGTLPNASDTAHAVAVDARGNIVAAGVTQNSSTGFDFTVVKFNGLSGLELWRQVIDGAGGDGGHSDLDDALAVAVDGAGDVVAAGFTHNTGTSSDFTVVKFAGGSGLELWRQVLNGSANSIDEALAVTVDGAGDVIAAGSFVQSLSNLGGFTVVKFAGSSGVELWRQMIHGTANGADFIHAVTVDGAGNVVAVGSTQNTGTFYDLTVVKFAGSSGVELWRQVINGQAANSSDWASAVTVDAAGDVVAVGVTQNSPNRNDFTVVKFAGTTGLPLWGKVISGTGVNSDSEALAATVDAAGDVVAAGFIQNSTGHDFTVVKLAGGTGVEIWRQVLNGTANGDDQARAVAVDRSGNVVAAGFSENTSSSFDFTVIKFAGTSGVPLWERVLHGTAAPSGSKFEAALAVAVDPKGDVVAAGSTQNVGTFFDFTVVKLDGTDGSSFCVRLLCFPRLFP